MAAPAGLCRIPATTVELSGFHYGGDPGASIAGVVPMGEGRYALAAGAEWSGEGDRTLVQAAGAYVVTGDPIGFMEGLFGPSITVGASAGVQFDQEADSLQENIDCGFQFSLFPSFALGMTLSDATGERELRTGFSHVFNRNLTAHVNYGENRWQGGAELNVSEQVNLYAGTDGDGFYSGVSWEKGIWSLAYSASLVPDSASHSLGVSRRWE